MRDFLISTSPNDTPSKSSPNDPNRSSSPNVPRKSSSPNDPSKAPNDPSKTSSSPNDPSKAPDQGVVAFLHLLTSLLPAEPSYPCLEFTVTSAIPLGAGRSSNSIIDFKAMNAKVAMSESFIANLSLTSKH